MKYYYNNFRLVLFFTLLISVSFVQITCFFTRFLKVSHEKLKSTTNSFNTTSSKISSNNTTFITTKQWTPEELVEKFVNFNNIFDPDKLLIKQDNNSMFTEIKNNNYTPVLIIISQISDEYLDKKTNKKNSHLFLKRFSKLILKKFTIEEDHDIIILISINDKEMNCRIGRKLREKLKENNMDKNYVKSILQGPEILTQLEKGDFSQAINFIFKDIEILIEKKETNYGKVFLILLLPILLVSMYYLVRSCVVKRKYVPTSLRNLKKYHKEKEENNPNNATNKDNNANINDPTNRRRGLMLNIDSNSLKNNNHTCPNSRLLSVEEVIKKFEEFNSLEKSPNESECNICTICLSGLGAAVEHSQQEEQDILVTEEIVLEPRTILDCNHIYHYDCLNYWYSIENKKCPTCRFSASEEIQDESNIIITEDMKTQFLKVVTQIQMINCIDLELFDLKVEEGKILWVFPEIEELSNI